MSYQALMEQAQALMAQAEAIQKAEKAEAIKYIKQKMAEHGLTPSDIAGKLQGRYLKVSDGEGSSAKKGPGTPPKYKGPQGQLWAGTKGPKPKWVKEALAAGIDIETYRIPGA